MARIAAVNIDEGRTIRNSN